MADCKFFSTSLGTLFRLDHIWRHKIRLNKFKSIGPTKYVLWPQYNEIENHNKKKFGNLTNVWKLNNIFLNDQWVQEEIMRKIRKYFERNENENTTYCSLWNASKSVISGKFIPAYTYLKKRRKASNNLTFPLEALEKRRAN